MEKLFVTKLEIKKVRHLKDITINLSDTTSRHLIFTGRNGSGKTSALDAIATYLKMKFQISDLNLEVASYLSGPVFAVLSGQVFHPEPGWRWELSHQPLRYSLSEHNIHRVPDKHCNHYL